MAAVCVSFCNAKSPRPCAEECWDTGHTQTAAHTNTQRLRTQVQTHGKPYRDISNATHTSYTGKGQQPPSASTQSANSLRPAAKNVCTYSEHKSKALAGGALHPSSSGRVGSVVMGISSKPRPASNDNIST